MRSIVSRCLRLPVLVFATLFLICLPVAGETAQCADPPGGAVTCESGQIASCTVKGGRVDGRCKTPPADKSGNELKAFVLSSLSGKAVSSEDVKKDEYKNALSKGHLETDGAVVNFKIPKELLKPPGPKD